MHRAVSVMAAFLAMIVPVSAAPLVPALRHMRDSLQVIADAVV
ncbi:MAG: hypothetical protein ABIQ84_08765 [Usitatibacter sp.]